MNEIDMSTWSANWMWSLPLIVVVVVFHTVCLGLLNRLVTRAMSNVGKHRVPQLSSQHIAYVKDAGNLPLPKDLPGLIYHQRALSNEFLLGAATGTSFLTVRASAASTANFAGFCFAAGLSVASAGGRGL